MKSITIMCGLPRSGKTTWVKRAKTSEVVVSADAVRLLVYNKRFWKDGEPLMWGIREIILKFLLEQGVDVILDETSIAEKSRSRIINLAKKHDYLVYGVELHTPVDICKQRAIDSKQEDLIPIIDKMSKQFEPLDFNEGFTDILYVNKEE